MSHHEQHTIHPSLQPSHTPAYRQYVDRREFDNSGTTPHTHEYVPTVPYPTYYPQPTPHPPTYPDPMHPHPPYYPPHPGFHWELVPDFRPFYPGVPYRETIPLSDLNDRRSIDIVNASLSDSAGENFD